MINILKYPIIVNSLNIKYNLMKILNLVDFCVLAFLWLYYFKIATKSLIH